MNKATRPPYEILEHTADIGLRAWGETREARFENCARGLAEILDRQAEILERQVNAGPFAMEGRNAVALEVTATDVEALLVEWMNEVLFSLEGNEACLAQVGVRDVSETRLSAEIELAPCPGTPEATELKAATYHQLLVRTSGDGWEATVYFDV